MKGFDVPRCPMCGEEGAELLIVLDDVTQFRCTANDCEFTTADVVNLIGIWTRVLKWTSQADDYEGPRVGEKEVSR